MRRAYKQPEAEAFLLAGTDLLMASGEIDGGTSGSQGGQNGNDPWIGEDGVIHLPPVPLG